MSILERFAAGPLAVFFLVVSVSVGQEIPSADGAKSKQIKALDADGLAFNLDGFLNEAVWQKALPISDFAQKEPVEFGLPKERTEVRLAYDEDALWIGATMFTNEPDEMLAIVSRRDNAGNSQRIIISLDTYGDKRTAYSFGVTATGVRIDYYHPTDAEYDRDYSFDPVWEAKTQIFGDRWTAEMRIPFSQLRFNQTDAGDLPFGLNINRWIPSRNEDVYWEVIPRNAGGWSSRMGKIEGLRGVQSTRGIEVLPYLAADIERIYNESGSAATREDLRIGADLKMGIGANFTLDATFNPDFGQVEADPAEVNLSAFETFFDERRPFFIEGSQLLTADVGPSYFYSRRIGAPPRTGNLNLVDEAPQNSTILGAAKFTGRREGGQSIGLLTALTNTETVNATSRNNPDVSEQVVVPTSLYSVARVQQETGEENISVFGVSFTSAIRGDLDTEFLSENYSEAALSGGADWDVALVDGEYNLRGHVGGSYVKGNTAYITQLQRSSARFYQRPDADYIEVDSNLTALEGWTASAQFERVEGETWLGGASVWIQSPGFELNDLGSLNTSDEVNGRSWLTYRENQPGNLFHRYSTSLIYEQGWNFGADALDSEIELSFNATFSNFFDMSASVDYDFEALNDDLTRGGPLATLPAEWKFESSVNSNFALNTRYSLGGDYSFNTEDGYRLTVFGSISYRGAGRLDISFQPWIRDERDVRQYVEKITGGRQATFGTRYVFGELERTTLALPLRFNYSFTPDLSLEFYAEPFASSGNYLSFGELAQAGGLKVLKYGEDIGETDPTFDGQGRGYLLEGEQVVVGATDFLVTSFRSNMVLRWEWTPGATAFLVWQQNGAESLPISARAGVDDIFDSISNRSDSFIGIKVSYWLPIRY